MSIPSFKRERKIYYQIKFLTGDIALSFRYVRYTLFPFHLMVHFYGSFSFYLAVSPVYHILTRRHNLSHPPPISSISRLDAQFGSARRIAIHYKWIIYLSTDSLPFFVAPLR